MDDILCGRSTANLRPSCAVPQFPAEGMRTGQLVDREEADLAETLRTSLLQL